MAFWGVLRAFLEIMGVAKQDPKESRQLMLRRSQWQALRKLAKEHGCTPGDVVSALIEVHLRNFASKLDVHLARLKSTKL